jgi:hypothetical protein
MGWVVNATPRPLYRRERESVPLVPLILVQLAGWEGLDRCGKSRPLLAGFDPQTVQLVASRYSDLRWGPPRCGTYVRIFTLEQIYWNVSWHNDDAVTACDTDQFSVKLK